MSQHIAILDFGSQYTHLIARRIRELGVQAIIYPPNTSATKLEDNIWGLVLSGGPRSVVKEPIIPHDTGIFSLSVPILGLCYGHQLIAKHFGGQLSSGEAREYGEADLDILLRHTIFKKVPRDSSVWMSHGDHVSKVGDDFSVIAQSGDGIITGVSHNNMPIIGFQFHPEVAHSEFGFTMLKNFVFDMCQSEINWSTAQTLDHLIEGIRRQAHNKNIFCLLSGGVDSTVCYALLKKANLTGQIRALHIDHGFMRKDESHQVVEALSHIDCPVDVLDASDIFDRQLEGIVDPEKKRHIIGKLFMDVSKTYMQEHDMTDGSWLLCQGTIYPDTIESGDTEHADTIKTHHNRVESVKDMIAQGLIIEPIKELYKDEVREVGHMLGLPDSLVQRHPFPGPGLAIRCLCSDGSNEKATLMHNGKNNIYKLPIKSVGVQGDERSYAHPALVLHVELTDPNLAKQSSTLTNAHSDINRVLTHVAGDITRLDESTVRTATLTKKRTTLLQEVDAIVMKHVHGLEHIWQMPVVLVPFGYNHGESIVLRPVESSEAMTVSWANIGKDILDAIAEEVTKLPIDYIFYDITNKPPGTIEWE